MSSKIYWLRLCLLSRLGALWRRGEHLAHCVCTNCMCWDDGVAFYPSVPLFFFSFHIFIACFFSLVVKSNKLFFFRKFNILSPCSVGTTTKCNNSEQPNSVKERGADSDIEQSMCDLYSALVESEARFQMEKNIWCNLWDFSQSNPLHANDRQIICVKLQANWNEINNRIPIQISMHIEGQVNAFEIYIFRACTC